MERMIVVKLFVRDVNFYKKAAAISIPISMQSLISIGVNMTDTIMIGSLGENALSATALANQFVNIFHIGCMGIAMGASVLTARYWGMKDLRALKKTITIMLRICVLFASLFMAITIISPLFLMRLYTNDNQVINQGVLYLKWMVPCYLLMGLSLTCTIVLRSVGHVRIPLLSSIGALFVNIFFNYILIFGKLGAPQMGVEGAALGTMIARIFEFLFICVYFFFIESKIAYRIRDLHMNCKSLILKYMSVSLPVFVSDILLAIGSSVLAMIMGRIGKDFVSANSITMVTQQLSTVLIHGICHSGCIITGHTLGKGEKEKAQEQAYTFMILGLIIGAVASVIILVIKDPVINIYNITDRTKELAKELMNAIAFIVIFQSTNSIMTKGVLRGGGDTKFLMVADVLLLWIISIPLGFMAGLVWKLPAFWIYIFLKIDQVFKTIWCIFRLASKKWIKSISS